MEDFNHFLIRNLSKIVIVEANRSEHRVVFETHYVVGLAPQFGKAIARRHRHRKQPRGSSRPSQRRRQLQSPCGQ
jgi:hypothetical protein